MARKPRVDVEGGLYHVIARGNNRRRIFDAPDDYQKFLCLLEIQKSRLPYFLYAYCLMTNHVHLLIERQTVSISRIMHRVLTGYSQYYNRKYLRSGHLLQGRHKSILCQSERYLAELVRYIHLNPVRAKMVRKPENYPYSSHHAYLGLKAAGIVDVDSVLRHFGAKKKAAREHFGQFVRAGIKLGHREEFYRAEEGRILGSEEFVDKTIHRIGETKSARKKGNQNQPSRPFDAEALLRAVESACLLGRIEFCGSGKKALAVEAKETLIVVGLEAGATMKMLASITGLSSSALSRRLDAVRCRARNDKRAAELIERVEKHYSRIAESQA
jgi:putative transposase